VSIDDFAARLSHTPVPWWVARAASWALAGYAIVTGIDLLHPPAAPAFSLKMVERLASLHTWGIWFLITGSVLTLGLLVGRHVLVWLGHFACSILYFGFAGATFQAVWQYQHSPYASQGGWIWRAAYVALMIAVGHFALAWFRGPIPRRGEAE
jgi:hypothetical protein